MDNKSTPIDSLNSAPDDSQVVNNILTKYNNLQSGSGELPPINPNIPNMEKEFDNRNLNKEMYNHSSQNIAYENDYKNEIQRTAKFNQKQNYEEDEYEDEEYEEVEEDVVPLWKKVFNELRIPLFIMIMVLIFMNKKFEKMFVKSVSFFGNQFNEVNTYGFVMLSLFVALSSYLMIRFIRI
jgi:hypothetical protein